MLQSATLSKGSSIVFRFRGTSYKVTDNSEIVMKDFQTLCETGHKIKAKQDGTETAQKVNLEFSYFSLL